jgi:endonuclease III
MSNESISKKTDELVKKIMCQTTYNEYEATEKLCEHNYDYIKVIKEFMGIKENKNKQIKSINQEIYKQIRYNLETSMKEYREKNPINLDEVVEKLSESERNKQNKQS